jgi:(1->4)-alpha-D-glucan 1-alpha-D-glucosylmutase
MTVECIERTLGTEARIPSSTYRLQMHENFTFEDAERILPYLKLLGIGDVYLSPIFEARPHSTHGYDVARHECVNPELGGYDKFRSLSAALRQAGMGLLLDIVPNHMGVGNKSEWWQDVLQNGQASAYSDWFDIDWEPLKPELRNKLLLPILGSRYGDALESKQIEVQLEDGQLLIAYFDHRMPIDPRTLHMLFPKSKNKPLKITQEFRSLLDELSQLPPHESTEAAMVERRRLGLNSLMPRLQAVLRDPKEKAAIDQALIAVNGRIGDPSSFDSLHALLEAQVYRLAYWRTSSEQINYRRFFDVNDLVGLRMENPEVFAKTHSLVRRLLANGDVTGLRIDHCDGMFNPGEYLVRLQQLFLAAMCYGPVGHVNETTPSGIERSVFHATRNTDWSVARLPLYCVVEKILEPEETLPRVWAVQGTSGYDFVHFANQLFIQSRSKNKFDRIYSDFIGGRVDPFEVIYKSKRNILLSSLSSELRVLANLLSRLASQNRRMRDFTDSLLETVIRETIACFPIYRTYIDERGQVSEADAATIRSAIWKAKRRSPDVDSSAFDYLQSILLLEGLGSGDEAFDGSQLHFALKFQQLTGPVMAKGVEDTSFYVYFRFISSNEVGSAMDAFGISAETFHNASVVRLKQTPHTLLTTSTHDTKRSEDVRNRLNVLSEIPQEWETQVRHWAESNARFKTTLEDGTVAPNANEEYLIYQTIVGAWPWLDVDKRNFTGRMKEYMAKALSESKVNVSWFNPWPEYTGAVQTFIDRILTPETEDSQTEFVSELERFLEPVKIHGAVNSIAQMVLKATCPGVPDFYQGTETWDLSLVDPDNRRPVDYGLRFTALEALLDKSRIDALEEVVATIEDGRIKLLVMHTTLAVRNAHRSVFDHGDYTPLETSNPDHAFAFLRGDDLLVIIPRFSYTLAKGKPELPTGQHWSGQQIRMPDGLPTIWTNSFTGKTVQSSGSFLDLTDALADLPVAILVRRN